MNIAHKPGYLDQPFTLIYDQHKQFLSRACVDHILKTAQIAESTLKNYRRGVTSPPASFVRLFIQIVALYYPNDHYQISSTNVITLI